VQTNFSPDQRADVHIAEADKILKSCQHYGFCTSGCPTYVLLHDENDSPRGRVDLIKEMLARARSVRRWAGWWAHPWAKRPACAWHWPVSRCRQG
jgi:glycolate oxidase iron-sulfur subunit